MGEEIIEVDRSAVWSKHGLGVLYLYLCTKEMVRKLTKYGLIEAES
ncbi:MAG TPA: hypothetical protein GXX75_27445 [Clostridiales bacterium]|nr:hypothetical protein [Clostridiales bacterium]